MEKEHIPHEGVYVFQTSAHPVPVHLGMQKHRPQSGGSRHPKGRTKLLALGLAAATGHRHGDRPGQRINLGRGQMDDPHCIIHGRRICRVLPCPGRRVKRGDP